jgi:anti-sigma-K factor RskA
MSESGDTLRDLAPGYVLGALSPEEAGAFEAALAGSSELRQEIAEYRELMAVMGAGAREAPPVDLKARVLERVRAETGVPLRSGAVAPASTDRTATHRALIPILGLGLAAAVLLAVWLGLRVGALGEEVRARDSALAERDARLAAREATLNALLEPGVQLTTLTATGEAPPVVQVFWDRVRHSAIVNTFRLRPAPSGRVYQLWLLPRKGKPIPSQVFNTEATGHQLITGIPVPAEQDVAGFALTVEPPGGSPQPTSQPFLVGMASGR